MKIGITTTNNLMETHYYDLSALTEGYMPYMLFFAIMLFGIGIIVNVVLSTKKMIDKSKIDRKDKDYRGIAKIIFNWLKDN